MRHWKLLPAALLLILAFAPYAHAEDAEARAKRGGELTELHGYPVLRLRGTDMRARGFAHGYYLADKVIACLDDALRSLPWFSAKRYEEQLRPWATKNFHWDADADDELAGLYDGMAARQGAEHLRSEVLGRALKPDDLHAINTIADWFGPACSGFTVWGKLSAEGEVLHGRNLDFPIGGRAVSDQIVLAVEALPARDGRPARRAWIGVGWPGLVSLYSGMNADGLVICLHDANNVLRGGAEDGFVARGVLLRRMLEEVDPAAGDPASAAAKLAAERPTACGNLFHLSWPRAAAEKTGTTPSAVLEFDARDRDGQGGGVAIRRMDASGRLVVTNHYCVRNTPESCERFGAISRAIDALSLGAQTIRVAEARRILIGGKLAAAAHTLVFEPDARRVHVSISRGNLLSPFAVGTAFRTDELLGRE
ncbi:MAG: C45 family autoproteolytic acyltransferase/hydrolase [Planctomycetota bacterium]|nr:C45 family autoproteolytic acyltransferase/hydrolase [Planctomycetota bacterium]